MPVTKMKPIGRTVFGLLLCMGFVPAVAAGQFNCIIEPSQVVEIRSPLPGLIAQIAVHQGDFVHAGQELAVLDTSLERAQAAIAKERAQMDGAILSAQSVVDLRARAAARARELLRKGLIPANNQEEAVTEKRVAEAALQEARDNRKLAELEYQKQLTIIRLKTIVSPIDGVVTERVMSVGELAQAGMARRPILRLAAIDKLYVQVLLPAAVYGQVKPGLQAQVVPQAGERKPVTATVKDIEPVVNAASQTFRVRMELPNAQHLLPAGIHCTADFPEIKGEAPTLPAGEAQPAPRRWPSWGETQEQ